MIGHDVDYNELALYQCILVLFIIPPSTIYVFFFFFKGSAAPRIFPFSPTRPFSDLPPARNSVRKQLRSYLRVYSPFGSSRLTARNAVGAVNRTRTWCWEITRQNAPGSGVPTGFPSYRTVVLPLNSGP